MAPRQVLAWRPLPAKLALALCRQVSAPWVVVWIFPGPFFAPRFAAFVIGCRALLLAFAGWSCAFLVAGW